ncbi:MAG: glucosamine-6-phosphate deaminase [Spirochaetales bacterium]
MKIYIYADKEKLFKDVSRQIIEEVCKNPNCTLGFPTGSTPMPLYKNLIEDYSQNKTSYKGVTTFNLDEYVGLKKNDVNSYHYYMMKNLFNHIDINLKNANIPNGVASNLEKECARYDALLEKHNIDIQILGLGVNGHIGFNEPNTLVSITTHVVNLSNSTIEANARNFNSKEEVPTRAITMGLKNILNAKEVILIATGLTKASAVKMMIEGTMCNTCPASILQTHPNAIIYLDEEAASALKNSKNIVIKN